MIVVDMMVVFCVFALCSELCSSNNSDGHTASIFRMTELVQVDANVIQWQKMCYLYTLYICLRKTVKSKLWKGNEVIREAYFLKARR